MAISFVGQTTKAYTGAEGAASTPFITLPGAALANDVAVMVLMNAGIEDSTVPTGWTERKDILMSQNGRMFIATKTLDASDISANHTWTMAAATNPPLYSKMKLAVAVYRGATYSAIGTEVNRAVTATTTAAPSVTTTTSNEWIIGLWSDRVSSQTSVTAPASMTQDAVIFATEGGGASILIAHENIAAASATGTRTATYAVTSPNGAGVLVRLAAASGTPPVVSAGADKETAINVNRVLGTDASSTGTTHSWTVDSGPASPTISSSTSLTLANVTPTVAGHYVIRLTSTNVDGSTSDTMNLYATDDTAIPDSTPLNPGGYVIVGGSATVHEALADGSDGTYVESVDPSTGDAFTVVVTPLNDGTVTVTTRAKSSTTPELDFTVALMQGTTVIASDTFTSTTSFADYSFTTTSGETALITDYNNLRVRVTSA